MTQRRRGERYSLVNATFLDAHVTNPATEPAIPKRDIACGICGGSTGAVYAVREMMFGTGEVFHYFACADCGCVQIIDPPADLSRYYPASYYSYAAPNERTGLRGVFRRLRNRGTFPPRQTRFALLERALARAFPYPIPGAESWMSRLGARFDSRILDLGSGSGTLLFDLATAGYRRLTGADPFVSRDLEHPNGVRILKRTVGELTETFDVIMMHHSFEHVADPDRTMHAVAERLAANGVCLIRIPTSSSWAWDHYRQYWVQLDAPRHFFIHSRKSLSLLAERSGLEVFDVVDDSTEFQFTGSELYRGGRSLTELPTAYSRHDLREYRRRAEALNREQRGDQAAFYLRHRTGAKRS